MHQSRRQNLILLGAAFAAPLLVPQRLMAQVTTHDIAMLNVDPENPRRQMVFSPSVLRIAAGDTVQFRATDRGHNAQSLDGMTPEGAEPFRSRIGEEIALTMTVEGAYGYVCQPHQTMGMLGLILVGDFTANLDAVREAGERLRGRASTDRFADYLQRAEAIATEEGLT